MWKPDALLMKKLQIGKKLKLEIRINHHYGSYAVVV